MRSLLINSGCEENNNIFIEVLSSRLQAAIAKAFISRWNIQFRVTFTIHVEFILADASYALYTYRFKKLYLLVNVPVQQYLQCPEFVAGETFVPRIGDLRRVRKFGSLAVGPSATVLEGLAKRDAYDQR